MNPRRDKKIVEALGLCWHEWKLTAPYIELELDEEWTCIHCDKYYGGERDDTIGREERLNPNFSTADGELLILQKGPEREWWEEFIDDIGAIVDYEDTARYAYMPLELIQSPDRLADKLYEFLEGKDDTTRD